MTPKERDAAIGGYALPRARAPARRVHNVRGMNSVSGVPSADETYSYKRLRSSSLQGVGRQSCRAVL
jgi:hypothetical protein